MIKTFLLLTFSLLFLAFPAFGQNSVTIKSKKTTYTRKGKNLQDFKKTFTVDYPIVTGALKPAVKTKLDNTLSYWRVFGTTLKEAMSETWTESIGYEVNFNKNSLLDITLYHEGSGAYPDSQIVNLVVDLKTGEQIKLADVLTPNTKLAAMVNKKLQAEVAETIKQVESDPAETQESKDGAKEMLTNLKFEADSFNEFRVTDKGIAILYDAGFPHVAKALQPAGNYFFTYAELKPFVKKGSAVNQFVR